MHNPRRSSAAPSLSDVCPKCNRELGEHDGKKCPKSAAPMKPLPPRDPKCTCRPKPAQGQGHFLSCPLVAPPPRLSPEEARDLGAAWPEAAARALESQGLAPKPSPKKQPYKVKRHRGVRTRATTALTLSADDVRRLDVIAASQGMSRSGWVTAIGMQTFRARFPGMTLDDAELEFPPKRKAVA